ncbi:hypothetical protein DPEC_G00349000 [Dallia pectoralis]|uniref:Uncharacterized protein n=1 Tax=Dallia pectoralis TaxID=75939 RepID=A0ACC2F1A4_DALPE|nr:hypothetical protein DPEC_G00349000 [Dallia pectoralis]
MTTYCLTLLRCAILLSVHTGLTWEQQGVPCLHPTYLNTEYILPLDTSRSSLLRTQTCGYPLAEHKNLPMIWSLHHLNNEPDLNIGLCMTSSKKIGQVPRVDHHEFLPLLDSESSRVVLVGHGSKGSNGVARLGGYGPDKLAKVLAAMEIEDGRLHSLNLVGCALGKDLQFAEQLLQALRSHNVDTELHLSTSELSVSPSGEILTREEGVWRQQDSSKKVIAQLDQNGIIMSRVEGSNRGQRKHHLPHIS